MSTSSIQAAPNFTKFNNERKLIFRGTFVDFPKRGDIRIRTNSQIVVYVDGFIESISQSTKDSWHPSEMVKCIDLPNGTIMIPGFIDCHVHAPQYKQTSTKTDLPLMEWLQKYTFPAEDAFKNNDHARKVYTQLVQRLLRNGTTTALYFGSQHLDATTILAEICNNHGQRALIGRVCMDQNSFGYEDTTQICLEETEAFIQWCHNCWPPGSNTLVSPVITPRFVPTCSETLLCGLGELAKKYDCRVQTHVSESVDQVAMVREMYPISQRDVRILRRTGLLTPKAILAHCVHLHNDEALEVAAVGASIASCPYSNMLFARGVLPVQRFARAGVKIGLGTDIAGGHSSNMVSAVRMAGLASRVHGFQSADDTSGPKDKGDGEIVDWVTACWHATIGGAQALGLKMVGCFEVGMRWDAVEVDLYSPWVAEREENLDDTRDLFERWVVGHGSEHDINNVWVDGKNVYTRNPVKV